MRLRLLPALLVLLALAAPSFAGWGPSIPFDTGWRAANDAEPTPIVDEPTECSATWIPGAPAGATLARVRIQLAGYRPNVTAVNASTEAATFAVEGFYSMHLANRPGLYLSHVTGQAQIYLAGCGYDYWPAYAANIAGLWGGGGEQRIVEPGAAVYEPCEVWLASYGAELVPADKLAPRRRNFAPLFFTSQGDYSWAWSWTDGTAPPGWQGHSPLAYTMHPECRAIGTVEYYVP